MRERDVQTRCDVTYPYERRDPQGNVIEVQAEPSNYDIRFIYSKGKKGNPLFRIFGQRIDKEDEQYEIDIVGHKRIKGVMQQFEHEYMLIVDNLRIMGDALVLLNPAQNQASKSVQITNQSESKIEAYPGEGPQPVGASDATGVEHPDEKQIEGGTTEEGSRIGDDANKAGLVSFHQNKSNTISGLNSKEGDQFPSNQIKIQDEVQADGAKDGANNNA